MPCHEPVGKAVKCEMVGQAMIDVDHGRFADQACVDSTVQQQGGNQAGQGQNQGRGIRWQHFR